MGLTTTSRNYHANVEKKIQAMYDAENKRHEKRMKEIGAKWRKYIYG